MYTYEYRFYPRSFEPEELDVFIDNMQWFISCLYKNGQILSEFQNTVKCADSAKPPELLYIGENYDVEDSCTCEAPSHYILFSECLWAASPIICGDCKCPVPLYKFPKTYDGTEYFDLLGWQKAYRACDRQFYEGIGERHGYKMMHDPNSLLSKEALQYCSIMEEKTGKPFYYFLFTYYKKNKPVCPKCGEPWANQKHAISRKIRYDFVCHQCRLVADDPNF